MYLLFNTAGKFHVGRILSETDNSAQVELDTGRRVKVKAATMLLRFQAPEPAEFMAQAQAQADEVDPALAWEFAPDEEFGFAELAADYFGDSPSLVQQAAALLALHAVPHYFRRAGRGRFRKAPADVVAKALAAIERKRQIAEQVDAWAAELQAGSCPAPITEQLYQILFKPDKNAPEYKAVAQAAWATQETPLALLTRAGAIASAYQFHWQRFLFENFPGGTDFPPLEPPVFTEELPTAAVQAFSIDDADTTEIDDALSVQGLGSGRVIVGIHIAAPGLAIQPGDPLDVVGRARLSTVYMPGYKITMFPPEVVEVYALTAGHARPAISLYLTLDEGSLEILDSSTRLERVPVVVNLRHEQLEGLFAPDAGAGSAGEDWREPLEFLHSLVLHLKRGREQVRGKPEVYSRPDYSFRLLGHEDGTPPTGDEEVVITQRQRGGPLDLIVSELMVLANSTWGEWLKALGVPAIYRSQAALAPGVKVRMGTRALPHAGIGVPSYSWSTSPLRRYVDLVNQWQLIAAARHGNTAALAAPFKPKDAQLLAIISAFDAAYSAYGRHQAGMERYWALRHLQQSGASEITARLLREQSTSSWLARAENLPLVFSVLGNQLLAPGYAVRVSLGEPDLVALDLHGTVAEVLAEQPSAATDDDEDGDESREEGGPLAVAVEAGPAQEGAPQDEG